MTNLEYLIENKEKLNIENHTICGLCYLIKHKKSCTGAVDHCRYSCEFFNHSVCYEFLNKEYPQPIKMKQFEFDFMAIYVDVFKLNESVFINDRTFKEMYKIGYYKNVNIYKQFKEILEKAVIVDDK